MKKKKKKESRTRIMLLKKINRLLAKLTKREQTQINKIIDEQGDTARDTKEIQKIMKTYL